MKSHMLHPILIMLLLINAFFSSHLWSYATLLTVKVYQPYSFKISFIITVDCTPFLDKASC